MKRKRRIALALALVFCVFTGCSGQPAEESSQPTDFLKNDGRQARIVLGEINNGPERTAVLREIGEKYCADFPETDVFVQTFSDREELEEALREGKVDIAEVSDKEQPRYVKDGLLLDIRPYFDRWEEGSSLNRAASYIAGSMGKEKIYLMPSDYSQLVLYYRLDWTEEFNQGKPEREKAWYRTWTQIMRIPEYLGEDRAKLAFAGKDRLTDLFHAVIWSALGSSRLEDPAAAYYYENDGKKGTVFSTESAAAGMQQFTDLIGTAFLPDTVNWTEEQAIQAFQEGRAGILLADRSAASVLRETMPEGSWQISTFPQGLTDSAVMPLQSFTGWGISPKTEEPEIAAHFLTFLSNADNSTHYAVVCGTAPIHIEASLLEPSFGENDFSAETDMVGKGSYFTYAGLYGLDDANEESLSELDGDLRDMISGKLSGEELLERLDGEFAK